MNENARVMMERSAGIALWRQIAEKLRTEVNEGILRAGTQLPPEWALAERFGVNRHTVRRALAALATEGLLRSDQGRGTFVEESRLSYPIGRRTRFSEIVSRQAREPGGRLIEHRVEPADPWVAERLLIEAGTPVLRLETIHGADGVPISTATAWFPAERFPGLVAVYAASGSITKALAAEGVADYTRRSTRVSARVADPVEADRLSLSSGAVLLVAEAVNVDEAGRPVEVARTRFSAERVEIVIDNSE